MAGFATSDESVTPEEAMRLHQLEKGLRRLSSELSTKGIRVAVLNGLPLAREANCTPAQAYPQWFNTATDNRCNFISRELTLKRRLALDETLRALENDSTIRVIDLFDSFCSSGLCTYQSEDGAFLYRDIYSHPSVEAARMSSTKIEARLAEQ